MIKMKQKTKQIGIEYEGTPLEIDIEIRCDTDKKAEKKAGKFRAEFQNFIAEMDDNTDEKPFTVTKEK